VRGTNRLVCDEVCDWVCVMERCRRRLSSRLVGESNDLRVVQRGDWVQQQRMREVQFTCFTSTKVQILTPDEQRYEYRGTHTDTKDARGAERALEASRVRHTGRAVRCPVYSRYLHKSTNTDT
jgi:hypothetical protein